MCCVSFSQLFMLPGDARKTLVGGKGLVGKSLILLIKLCYKVSIT